MSVLAYTILCTSRYPLDQFAYLLDVRVGVLRIVLIGGELGLHHARLTNKVLEGERLACHVEAKSLTEPTEVDVLTLTRIELPRVVEVKEHRLPNGRLY